MRLRERKCFVIVNDNGGISSCKSGLLSMETTGHLGLVSSSMSSCRMPATKGNEWVSFPQRKNSAGGKRGKGETRERSLQARNGKNPHSLPPPGFLTERHLASASRRMSRVLISFLTSQGSCED